VPEPATYSAEEVDAAVAALSGPDRFRHAQDVITHAAPTLQRVLSEALEEGGWFGDAMDKQVAAALGAEDPYERLEAVRALIAEETRLGMLVGATAGFELARELARRREGT
jgi:pyruvate carboxylase